MLSVTYDKKADKFRVSSPASDVDLCRAFPIRAYDDTTRTWVVANVQRNRNFMKALNRETASFDKRALDALSEVKKTRHDPLPLGFKYKTQPFAHQKEANHRSVYQEAFAFLGEPGTGKTKQVIDDISCNFFLGIRAAVIVCPNSIKSNWTDEFGLHSMVEADILEFSPPAKKLDNEFLYRRPPSNGVKVLIVAIESLSQGRTHEYVAEFLRMNNSIMTVDESSRIKNYKAIRTQRCIELGTLAVKRRIGTGTPAMKGLHQFWSQFEFLDPNILNLNYFAFRNYFCLMGGYKGKLIIGDMNQEEFKEMVAQYCMVVLKKDCFDLPEKLYKIRRVEMTPQQKRMYDELANEKIAETKHGTLSYEYVLTRDLRLQQITAGLVHTDPKALENGELSEARLDFIDGGNPKLEDLIEYHDEIGGKVVVWCKFRKEIELVVERLRSQFGDGAVVEFHGGRTNDQRATARQSFQSDPSILWFVGQVDSGGIGITLHSASIECYLSNSWDAEVRRQSEDRCHRAGAVGREIDGANRVLIVDYLVEGQRVDTKIRRAVMSGMSYGDAILQELQQVSNRS